MCIYLVFVFLCKSGDTCKCDRVQSRVYLTNVQYVRTNTAESQWCDSQLIRVAGYQSGILGSRHSFGTLPPPLFPQAFWPHARITGTQSELASLGLVLWNLTDGVGIISTIETQANSADFAALQSHAEPLSIHGQISGLWYEKVWPLSHVEDRRAVCVIQKACDYGMRIILYGFH